MIDKVRCVVWMTGYSGSGKSTLAQGLHEMLSAINIHSVIIDGDIIRQQANADLSFSDNDRFTNAKRVVDIVNNKSTDLVIVSLISPFNVIRDYARTNCICNIFLETFVNSSLEVCEKRDSKGLYKKARRGEIVNFTGISSKFQTPVNSDIIINTETTSVQESTLELFKKVCGYLKL